MKKFALLFLLILSLPLFLVGCSNKTETILTNYFLELEFKEESKTLFAHQEINYVNNSENAFDKLYFHIYPNAFREGAKREVVSLSDKERAYPNGESYAKFQLKSVTDFENVQLEYILEGEDENILALSLPKQLYPNEYIKIQLDFELTLANIHHRLGYGENTINFGNFYPIACVYNEGEGFKKDLYHSNGDPFFSDCANYKVSIIYPKEMTLATTGESIKRVNNGNEIKEEITAKKVRDFCFVLSDKFDVVSKMLGKTKINYFGYKGDENLEENLKVSQEALSFYNDTFGEYPYNILNVVKANFVQGGMEYPNLVLISDECQSQSDFDYVIAHEIAHQWWYGVVGSDEYNHAWQDEGLTEYSTLMFFENHENFGQKFESMMQVNLDNYKYFEKIYKDINGDFDTSMDRPLNKFKTEPEYVHLTYTKGALMFDELRSSIGNRKFKKALKCYYKDFAFKNASPEELIDSFSKSTGVELEGFFRSWLSGSVVII